MAVTFDEIWCDASRGFGAGDVRVVFQLVAQLLKEETEPFVINDEACQAQRFFSGPTGGIDSPDFDAASGL